VRRDVGILYVDSFSLRILLCIYSEEHGYRSRFKFAKNCFTIDMPPSFNLFYYGELRFLLVCSFFHLNLKDVFSFGQYKKNGLYQITKIFSFRYM
jgi:hypothetical protein